MTPEALEALMVKSVDGLLSPEERETLARHLRDHPELARELEAQSAIKAVTDGWMARLEADLLTVEARQTRASRMERGAGLAMLLIGLLMILGPAAAVLMTDAGVPWPIRLGLGLGGAGIVLLLFHVVRTRYFGARDPYDEVMR